MHATYRFFGSPISLATPRYIGALQNSRLFLRYLSFFENGFLLSLRPRHTTMAALGALAQKII